MIDGSKASQRRKRRPNRPALTRTQVEVVGNLTEETIENVAAIIGMSMRRLDLEKPKSPDEPAEPPKK